MAHLFEENRPGPSWTDLPGDTFFQNATDGFPVQPEPDPGPPPGPRPRPAAPDRGRSGRPEPRYRDEPSRAGFTPTPQMVAGIVVAVIGVLVLAVFMTRILRVVRTDTIAGAVAAGSGGASWQVSFVIPEQAPANSFSGPDAASARVGLPVTISVPAAGISGVSGVITKLVSRTDSEGGGFAAVVQPRAGTKVIPAPGKTAEVTLGS